MQRMFLKMLAVVLLMASASYGQSLGDIARENRDKKAQDPSSEAPKVITNKDLPKDPDAAQESTDGQAETDTANNPPVDVKADQRAARQSAHRSAQQRLYEQRAADQWKRQIVAQKNRVAVLQARIDQLNELLRSSGGSVQYEAPYNRDQVRQLRRISQVQQQLDEQKMRLAEMQETARRAGMHTVVYDP